MPHIEANGVRFHVQDLGTGPAVVMLHGLLIGNLATWWFTAAPTLARSRHVRLYDLRGHGLSSAPREGYDLGTMAADLDALTADLPGPIDLVGHSFGALVALRFALDRPDRVRRLAIVEAPLPPSQYADVDPERLIEALPTGLREAVASGRRQAERLARTVAVLATETTMLSDLRAEPDFSDEALSALPMPVLCAYGDASSCLSAGHRLARVVPDARLVVLPGGHYLHLDATAALTTAIAAHLDA